MAPWREAGSKCLPLSPASLTCLALTLTRTLTLRRLWPWSAVAPWSCGTLSVRRVPVLADVEREERGEERDLIRDELELALRDVELPDRLRLG